MKSFVSNSTKETENIAKAFSKEVKKGDYICLDGDLGVGKTAFVRGFCKGFGYDEFLGSPTFTIVNSYEGQSEKLYHFDAYRLSGSDEMLDIGFEDYSDGICLIEWYERITEILPPDCYYVKIRKNDARDEDYREITIERS